MFSKQSFMAAVPALLAVSLVYTSTLNAQVVTAATGKLAEFSAKAVQNEISTQSTAFSSIPEMATSFTMESSSPVVITFCADCGVNTQIFSFGQLRVRATIDTNPIEPQPSLAWTSNGDSDNGLKRSHCFIWLAPDENSGNHTADIEWAMNASGGGIASCSRQSLLIQWGQACTADEINLCNDGLDNDCDGLADCIDTDCVGDPACGPPCGDGFCDPATEDQCSCAADCGTPPGSESGMCSDGIDNDCDGAIDCNDADCVTDPACCRPSGADCTMDIQCCSGNCRGNGICK